MWPRRPHHDPWGDPPRLLPGHIPGYARRRVKWKRWGVLALAAVAFVEWAGLPQLRWSYAYRGPESDPRYVHATYLGVKGAERAYPRHADDPMPLVRLQPLSPSPLAWGTTLARRIGQGMGLDAHLHDMTDFFSQPEADHEQAR